MVLSAQLLLTGGPGTLFGGKDDPCHLLPLPPAWHWAPPAVSSSSLYSRPRYPVARAMVRGHKARGRPWRGVRGCGMCMCVLACARVACSSLCSPSGAACIAPSPLAIMVPDVPAVATTCHLLEGRGLPLGGLPAAGGQGLLCRIECEPKA